MPANTNTPRIRLSSSLLFFPLLSSSLLCSSLLFSPLLPSSLLSQVRGKANFRACLRQGGVGGGGAEERETRPRGPQRRVQFR